jgi:hypothetical protein
MAHLESDVHKLNSAELGNLVITTLADPHVIMAEVRLAGPNKHRTMRVWYDDDPIDPDELAHPL